MTIDVRVRGANAADVAALMDLERQSPASAHWSRRQYQDLFGASPAPPGSQRVAWVVEQERGEQASVSGKDSEVVAFLVARQVDAEWELENIVVAAAARQRGIGARLLSELIAHARAEQGRSIWLEVRESNQIARALYQKAGFEPTGLRKRYYAHPQEDAILYRKGLC
jgi:ribosomal-protein-alanine N-acetyltransferase